jgi:hypothetical protein
MWGLSITFFCCSFMFSHTWFWWVHSNWRGLFLNLRFSSYSVKLIYVVLPRISENLLVITWILTLSPNFCCHLWSSHLGLVYSSSDFAIFGSTHWSLPMLAYLLWFCLDLFNGYEMLPFQPEFHFREQWSCFFFWSGIPSQQARCVQAHCHGATTSLCSSARMCWHYPVTVQCNYKHHG